MEKTNNLTVFEKVIYAGDKELAIPNETSSITSKCYNNPFNFSNFSYAGESCIVIYRGHSRLTCETPQHQNLFGVLLFFATLNEYIKMTKNSTRDSYTLKKQQSKHLVFQNQPLEIIKIDNQEWVTSASLSKVLGYKHSHKVTQLFHRFKDEFSPSMSRTPTLGIVGNLKPTIRVFSLRGCHLVAMLAKTKVAKDFRKWVLDILENHQQKNFEPVQFESPQKKLNNLLAINLSNPFAADVIQLLKKSETFFSKGQYSLILDNLITVINNTDKYDSNYKRLTEIYKILKSDNALANYKEFEAIADREERWREEIMKKAKKIFAMREN